MHSVLFSRNNIAGIVKGTKNYSGTVIYEGAEAKTVGRIAVRAPTSTGFTTNVSTILATATLEMAMGGQSVV